MVVDDHPMTRNGIADWIRREQVFLRLIGSILAFLAEG